MSTNNENKKNIRLGIIIFFAFAVLISILSLVDFDVLYAKLSGPIKIDEPEYTDADFYAPDYEANILQDPRYLALDRTLTWIQDGVSEKLSDNNYEKYHEIGILVHNYFEAMISGNASAYNNLFSESYKKDKDNYVPDRFPMQRVYEMTAEVLSHTMLEKGASEAVIKLSYKIQGNDGTVRRDVLSDSCVPIDITVFVDAAGNAEIRSITRYFGGDPLEQGKLPIALAVVLVVIPLLLIAGFGFAIYRILKRKKKAK